MRKSKKPVCLGGSPICKPIKTKWPILTKKDAKRVASVLHSGKIAKGNGECNRLLEEQTAKRNGRKYAITVNSATTGLELALRGLKIGFGDEVVVPAYTFYSSVSSIVAVGAVPVLCDVEPDSLHISEKFVECITPRTRAVMVVDWGGYCVDIAKIREGINGRKIKIIADSAQSFGAIGKEDTQYADVAVYSFQNSKNLTCGEGGAVVTDDEELYRYMYALHNCGRGEGCKWYEHRYNGTNIRMSELCAALTLSQLSKFDEQAKRRKENAELLIEGLKNSKIFHVLQTAPTERNRIYHTLPIACSPQYGRAEDYVRYIRSEGVPVIPSYEKSCDMQEAFQATHGRAHRDLSVTHAACGQTILVPQELLLVKKKQIKVILHVMNKIEKYLLQSEEKKNG